MSITGLRLSKVLPIEGSQRDLPPAIDVSTDSHHRSEGILNTESGGLSGSRRTFDKSTAPMTGTTILLRKKGETRNT